MNDSWSWTQDKLGEDIQDVENSSADQLWQGDEDQEEISLEADNQYEALEDEELYKNAIDKWDSFFVENKLIFALKNYQTAKKLSPDDKNLDIKIWDTHFKLHNYKQAYSYYKWNEQAQGFNKEKEVLSLLYWQKDMGETEIETLKEELQELDFSAQEKIYYFNSLQCAIDFSKCKQFFQDYFASEEWATITFSPLGSIKDGIDAFEWSQVDDLNYKNALVIWKFFENKNYPLVISLWRQLLEEFPDYDPMILMLWKSYYELWMYDEAHEILKPYHERNLEDEKVSYFLGLISIRRKYYLSSSIYFDKALDYGYTPEIDIKRKLVYNYFLIKNTEKMYKKLNELLRNPDANESDFALGIYQAIQDSRYDLALEFAKRWAVQFQDSARFYWYMADIYMRQEKWDFAKKSIEKWKNRDPKDTSVVYYEWKMFMETKEYNKAFIAFRRVIKLSWWKWEFVSSANTQLRIVDQELQKQKQNDASS